jgi:hypothetical protein
MKILRLANGYWVMGRDLFRGLIRIALVLCLMVSCAETFYFMGELSKNSHDRYNPYYNNSNSYYGRSSTIETADVIEEVDDYEQDTTRAYTQQEYEY